MTLRAPLISCRAILFSSILQRSIISYHIDSRRDTRIKYFKTRLFLLANGLTEIEIEINRYKLIDQLTKISSAKQRTKVKLSGLR